MAGAVELACHLLPCGGVRVTGPFAGVVRLALAVVEQSLDDMQRATKRRREKETDLQYQYRILDGEEARHFLLEELWRHGNVWGDVLRSCGVIGLDKRRVAKLVREAHAWRKGAIWKGYEQQADGSG